MGWIEAIYTVATEDAAVGTFLMAAVFIFGNTLHGIYFYFRYQRKLDKELMGLAYCDSGLLHGVVVRQGLYGMAVVFPAYWRFVPSIDRSKAANIKGRVRTHLWWHQLFAMVGVILFIATVIIDVCT